MTAAVKQQAKDAWEQYLKYKGYIKEEKSEAVQKLYEDPIYPVIKYVITEVFPQGWVEQFLNQNQFKYDPNLWFLVYEVLHLSLYGEPSTYERIYKEPKPLERSLCELYEKDQWIDDITEVTFRSMYPNIMTKKFLNQRTSYSNVIPIVKAILDKFRMSTENVAVGQIQYDMMRNKYCVFDGQNWLRTEMTNPNDDRSTHMVLKGFVNWTFGMMISNKNDLACSLDIPNMIVTNSRIIGRGIQEICGRNLILIDTDVMYIRDFHEVSVRLHDYCKEINMEYFIETNKSGIFFSPKKYILVDGGTKEGKKFRRKILNPQSVTLRFM